jgi:iron complex outermembrane recepter protein
VGRQIKFAIAATAAVLGSSGAALAQSTAPTDQSAIAQGSELEEIHVFAQKRNESLQSVPIAVTAVNPTDVSNLRLTTTNDLQQIVPNLTIGSVYAGVVPQITMRGVGVNDGVQTTAPSVGTYIDQVYVADTAAAVLETMDIGRIEVLRGPQGTLYGKNTNGGAINFYTARPTNDYQGEVDVEAGNYSERSGSAFLSGPILGPELTGRISGYYMDHSGYGVDLAPGPVQYGADQLWAEHDYAVRGELLYKPMDNMQWLLIGAQAENYISYGWPVLGLRNPANPAVDCANPFSGTCVDALGEHVYGTVSPYSTIQKGLSYTRPDTTFGSLQGTWTLDSIELTSVTGYIHNHTRQYDYSASDYVGLGLFNFDQNKHSDEYSEEFRVASVGQQVLNWTTGAYFQTFSRSIPVTYLQSGTPGTTLTLSTTESYAGFGQVDYNVTSQLSLTGGLRYSDTHLSAQNTNLGDLSNQAYHSWGSLGGRLSAQYKFTDSILAYASFNRGFKEGTISEGIYGTAKPPKPSYIKPETIDAYEVGFKSDLSRQYRLNGDIFYNKLKDMQVAGTDPANFNFPTVTNAARATTYGAELEATARPVPDLLLSANYGYLHAVFIDYYVLSVFSPAPDFPATLINASGKPIPLSPTNTFSAQAEYTIHLGDSTLAPRLSYSYKSTQTFTPEGANPQAAQSPYGLLGAGLKYDSADHLEVDVWGRNLTNKAYLIDSQPGDSFNGTDFLTYGQPRMYGVTLRKKF